MTTAKGIFVLCYVAVTILHVYIYMFIYIYIYHETELTRLPLASRVLSLGSMFSAQ